MLTWQWLLSHVSLQHPGMAHLLRTGWTSSLDEWDGCVQANTATAFEDDPATAAVRKKMRLAHRRIVTLGKKVCWHWLCAVCACL